MLDGYQFCFNYLTSDFEVSLQPSWFFLSYPTHTPFRHDCFWFTFSICVVFRLVSTFVPYVSFS